MIRLVGIAGRARSGKDSICDILCKELDCATRYALADPIKAALFGMIGCEYMTSQTNLMQSKEEVIPWLGQSPRAILQEIGGGLRNSLDPDIWLKFLARYCEEFLVIENNFVNNDAHPPLYVIVPDVRYDNEAKYIKDNDGIVIKVQRPDVESIRDHESERGISMKFVDHLIENDGSVQDLEEKVKQLLKEGDFE